MKAAVLNRSEWVENWASVVACIIWHLVAVRKTWMRPPFVLSVFSFCCSKMTRRIQFEIFLSNFLFDTHLWTTHVYRMWTLSLPLQKPLICQAYLAVLSDMFWIVHWLYKYHIQCNAMESSYRNKMKSKTSVESDQIERYTKRRGYQIYEFMDFIIIESID